MENDKQNMNDAPQANEKPEKKKKSKKKKTVIPVICIILALAIGLGGGYAMKYIQGPRSSVKYVSSDGKFTTGITSAEYVFPVDYTFNVNYKGMADKTVAGRLCVMGNIDPMPYSISNLDWNAQWPEKKANTNFQIYLQALMPVAYLTEAYKDTQNTQYLDCAQNLIVSWSKFEESEASQNNKQMWNRQVPALRVGNLIEFFLTANEAGYLDKDMGNMLVDMISEHGSFLYEDANYMPNTYIGLYQTAALAFSAEFLDSAKSDKWIAKTEERLKELHTGLFAEDGVERENSPAYHRTNMDLLYTAAKFLSNCGNEYGQQLMTSLEASELFDAFAIKPNGGIAEIGDTSGNAENGKTATTEANLRYGNDMISYASTLGESGKMPEVNSAFFKESGYYFFRDTWQKDNYNQATWMMFKSGYSTIEHKHADDNSFMLFSKGNDVFIDTGFYTKDTDNAYRKQLVSAKGHNTVVVDDKSYDVTENNSSLTGFIDQGQESGYDYAVGRNDCYQGVRFDRHFYNLKNAIILFDDLKSDESHTYSQLFQLSDVMRVIEQKDNYVLLTLGRTGYNVRITQLGENPEYSIIMGDGKKAGYGYYSRSTGKISKTRTVKFDLAAQGDAKFITLITIEDKDGNIENFSDIGFDAQSSTFTVKPENGNAFEISLKSAD